MPVLAMFRGATGPGSYGGLVVGLVLVALLGLPAAASPRQSVPAGLTLGEDRARVDTAGVSFDTGHDTTVLTGTVWYEDQRVLGRHRQRRDLDGQSGRGRRGREGRRQDFLGGVSMQVDVFEVDGGLALGRGCHRFEPVGRTTVASPSALAVAGMTIMSVRTARSLPHDAMTMANPMTATRRMSLDESAAHLFDAAGFF